MESFIELPPHCEFPMENLPYGVFTTADQPNARIGVAIGNHILDLSVVAHLFNGPELRSHRNVFKEETLNKFMALDKKAWKEARDTIQSFLSVDNPLLQEENLKALAFVNQSDVLMQVPVDIGDYTDFYSSIDHATNVGKMFRSKDNPLLPNWKYLPVGYHGRSSSIEISGTSIRRPKGQILVKEGEPPRFGATSALDFELEMAFFVGGQPNTLGCPISIKKAQDHIFGFVLLNDWSARDIQKWEYQPLGPFTAKNFATTISPWVVTTFALEPFLVENRKQVPEPMPYLKHDDPFNFDINLEVSITPGGQYLSSVICQTNYKYLYWTAKQQLAHHTITGCPVRPGDLIASGTISGKNIGSYGSLLELSCNGTQPISLLDGSQRSFLHDGDTVSFKGVCHGNGYTVGFGPCEGTVLEAHHWY